VGTCAWRSVLLEDAEAGTDGGRGAPTFGG
jgi:hypothetical protein